MAFKATPFADLSITTDQRWDPNDKGLAELMNEVLGDDDWEQYKKAHLAWDSEAADTKAGYKLPIARMVGDTLTVIAAQLGSAVAAINGARGGVDLPEDVRRAAYDNAVKYYKKAGVEDGDVPTYSATTKAARRSVPSVVLVSDNGELDLGDEGKPKWQHVANEGQFLGYRHGEDPFAFTRETFEQIVSNFQKNTQYKAGPDGVGMADVIPWDFEHASEQYAADGSIPTDGAPAQGWIREVKVVDGPDGKAQLWALSIFFPIARKYILEGQYKWSSVAVILNAVDSITGERIGALLTSIALTNHPFITDLTPLAASTKSMSRSLRISRWYDAAGNATEALATIKELLGLKELTPLSEVMTEVSKIRQWITTGTTPLGIDLQEIFASLRQILNLGALTTEIDVLDAMDKIAQRAIEEQAVGEGAQINSPGILPDIKEAKSASTNGGRKMIKILASKFGVKEIEAEVLEAADSAIELSTSVAKTLECSNKRADIVESIVSLQTDRAAHIALLKALETDADDAVTLVAELKKASKELDEMKPELDALSERVKEIDLKAAQDDVARVISANGFDESLTDALMLSREKDPKAFAEKWPIKEEHVTLTQSVATGGNVQQTSSQGNVIDLSTFAGKNKTQRALSYLGSKDPSFTKKDWDAQSMEAHKLLCNPNVIDGNK